jgi:hypothetical protein
LGLDFSPSNHG